MSNLIEFEDLKTVCRICLNKNKVLILLTNYLYGFNKTEGPLVIDVLADIMSAEIDNNHPKAICPQCLDQLKSAYNLKLKFNKSQEKLQRYEDSIIASYIKDEHIEIYDSDGPKYEPENCFDDASTALKTIGENSDSEDLTDLSGETTNNMQEVTDSVTNTLKTKNTLIENSEVLVKANVKKLVNIKMPLKMTKIERHDTHRGDTQVRCVDINKFVIEKKGSSANYFDNQHGFSPDVPVISDKNLEEKCTLAKTKLVQVKCVLCGGRYSEKKYKSHAIHCKQLRSAMLTCKECHKVFKRVKDLNYHIKLKHSLDSFPCKICGFVCINYSARRIHMLKNHGGGKSFICEICNKGFFYNASLLKHKSKHTRETQEVCNICGKSFHYKGALFYHIKMHTNERKYLCSFCERRFYTSQALQRHLDTHTGERRFKCQYCDKSFRSTSERRRHEMIHTGEKPYQCDYCDKRFTSKYNHDIHTAAHRGQVPCAICSGRYLNDEVLQLHLKFKHKVKLEALSTEGNITQLD